MRKCVIRVYVLIDIGGGGGRSIRKLWPLGIPDITIKTWVCWDETRISQLYHYVCEQLEIIIFTSEFTSIIQQQMRKCVIHVYVLIHIGGGGDILFPRSDQKVVAAWYPRHYTIKTWVCWDETRISQLYHYVCKHLEILLIYFFWINL